MQGQHLSSSKSFSSPQTETLYPLTNNFPLLPLPSSWHPLTSFLSMDLPVLDISHEWDHTLYVLLCLVLSLSIMCSRFVHIVACVRASLLFTAVLYSTVWMDHILRLYSSVNGHLGGFCLLALVNNAAMNVRVQTSVGALAFNYFGYTPSRGITRSSGNSVFNFLRLSSASCMHCHLGSCRRARCTQGKV